MPVLREVVSRLDRWFPRVLAEPWDAVGLVAGDPGAQVGRIMLAVDPTEQVVDDAVQFGADLLITHHPLWLSGVTSVAATDRRGRIVHTLIQSGCALFTAHTNADRAVGGVNDALAQALGLTDTRPVEHVTEELLRLTVYVPPSHREQLLDALSQAGAGRIGEYERCAYSVPGQGTFMPQEGANPHIGSPGVVEYVAEDRLEMVLPERAQDGVAAALRAVHPYEEPAFAFTVVSRPGVRAGLGRVGRIAPTTLAEFAAAVRQSLPATAGGVRFAGDPHAEVSTVAVCGGSGGSLLADVSGLADVFVTADLKHHPVEEHVAGGGCAVIDVAHWASEWPWCPVTAQRLAAEFGVVAVADERVTDPWTGRA